MKLSIKKKSTVLALLFISFQSCNIYIPENQMIASGKYNSIYHDKIYKEANQKEKTIIELIKDSTIKIIEETTEIKVSKDFYQVNDSINLEYFVFEAKSYQNVSFLFLGSGMSVIFEYKWLSELAKKTKSKIYLLHYREYGNSEGTISFKTQFLDNASFYDMISENEKVNTIYGYSMGSIFASYLATEKDIAKLVLLAPFSNTKEAIKHFKKSIVTGFKRLLTFIAIIKTDSHIKKLSVNKQLEDYKGSLIITHSKDDNTLPFKMSKSIIKSAKKANITFNPIQTGGHGAPFQKENWNRLINLINEN
jgi:hypothetical protein